jgi:2-iminobutanoate/2-iminopropanoate deaminase
MTIRLARTVSLADMKARGEFNEVSRKTFPGKLPARSALGASGLALDARVEGERIAHVPEGK